VRIARFALRAAGFALGAIGIVAGSVYTTRQRRRVLFYRDVTAELHCLIGAYRVQLNKAATDGVAATSVTDILANVPPVTVTSALGEVVVSIRHNGIDLSNTVRCRVTGNDRVILILLQKMLGADSKGIDLFGLGHPQSAPVQGFQLVFGIRVQPRDHPDCIAVDAKLNEVKANR
jgi:hypothetical protein